MIVVSTIFLASCFRAPVRMTHPSRLASLLLAFGLVSGPAPASSQTIEDATAALTGARKTELFGLEVDDVSFKLGCIFIRPNQWRTLKTRGSERTIPLWPQLEEILRAYLLAREQSGGLGSLLFPTNRGKEEGLLDNVDRLMDRIGERAGISKPRLHAFRHSYTAARIQTLEKGAPVHMWQVARELGHQSSSMIEDRYGHLARVTERSEVVVFKTLEGHATPIQVRAAPRLFSSS